VVDYYQENGFMTHEVFYMVMRDVFV